MLEVEGGVPQVFMGCGREGVYKRGSLELGVGMDW